MTNNENLNGVEQNNSNSGHIIVYDKREIIFSQMKLFHLMINEHWFGIQVWHAISLSYLILFSWRWMSTHSLKLQNGAEPPYHFEIFKEALNSLPFLKLSKTLHLNILKNVHK